MLSVQELQAACRARGMRAIGLSENRLRAQVEMFKQNIYLYTLAKTMAGIVIGRSSAAFIAAAFPGNVLPRGVELHRTASHNHRRTSQGNWGTHYTEIEGIGGNDGSEGQN